MFSFASCHRSYKCKLSEVKKKGEILQQPAKDWIAEEGRKIDPLNGYPIPTLG